LPILSNIEVPYSSIQNTKFDGITKDGFKDFFKSLDDDSAIKGCAS